jgi:hypothetical protein
MRKSRIVLGAFVGAAGAALVYFLAIRTDVHGRVLAHGSAAPIGGATVTLDCQKATLHGYRLLRTMATTTAANGEYRFAAAQLRGCGHTEVHAAAPGYLDAWDMRLEHALIDRPFEPDPKQVWLIDERDVARLNLEGLLVVSNIANPSSTRIPDDYYTAIASPFRESKRFAKTAQDFDWIRQNYCDRVKEHWNRTPEQSRTKLLQAGDVGDYENDVVRFCAGTGIPAPATIDAG